MGSHCPPVGRPGRFGYAAAHTDGSRLDCEDGSDRVTPGFQQGDALLVVEVQRDFCRGGALPVPGGEEVVPLLNRWIEAAEAAGVPIFVSRDWHPPGHPSFRERGGPWPRHCVQGSPGAEFHPGLAACPSARPVTKGVRFDRDQLSSFDETGLEVELRRLGVRRLFVGGLALDVCVRATVMDALRHGFEVCVIGDGTRAIDEDAGERALAEMAEAGARIETSS